MGYFPGEEAGSLPSLLASSPDFPHRHMVFPKKEACRLPSLPASFSFNQYGGA